MSTVYDFVVTRNPHASLFILFSLLSASFTIFAFDPERKSKKKKHAKEVRTIPLDLDSSTNNTETFEALDEDESEDDRLAIYEELLQQKNKELEEARELIKANEQIFQSMKREEALRIEAEKALEMVKSEMNEQLVSYKQRLELENRKVEYVQELLQQEQERCQVLEQQLHKQKKRTKRLEGKKRNRAKSVDTDSSASEDLTPKTTPRQKRVFTIM
eukprot:CAMPEP_0174260750 /NCGR_PEP_ID=MMETSP0439-20130205/10443_1 /TAXON_ID=0 /ORGANISM="Stereomyxa ramosa, Strain Chinc5" /LENGTH=215 /DNA_ID=CAMNT_0015345069 /DNA_START=31 /DNA_END=678 /DNA_ORIENTATION=+